MTYYRDITYKLRFYLYGKKGTFLSLFSWRVIYFSVLLTLYIYHLAIQKSYYDAFKSLLRFERDVTTYFRKNILSIFSERIINRFIKRYIIDTNRFLEYFVQSTEAIAYQKQFSDFGLSFLVRMKYPRENNDPARQGDLLILKPKISGNEKGVLLIQYDEGIKKFASIYDITKLADSYRIVVEPSTCDYQNPMFFLLYGLQTDVIFESQFEPDFQYIHHLNLNFIPIRLGAGDWANINLFKFGNTEKVYDLVMIANWLKWKRHELLFESLAKIKKKINRIALIGYPIDGAKAEDVKDGCKRYGLREISDFFERIPHEKVLKIIAKSKIGILLSKEEGANRGIYECFFSNVPVILTDQNRGVNRDHINSHTGILSSDSRLSDSILYMLRSYKQFNPRKWALENTGHLNSTNKLNEFIKNLALEKGEIWTTDIFQKHNSPHARYAIAEEQRQADKFFKHLERFLR